MILILLILMGAVFLLFRAGEIRTAAAARNHTRTRTWKRHPAGKTAEFRIPPRISGSASGSMDCSPVMPLTAKENSVTGEVTRSQRSNSGAEAIPCIR